MPKFYDLCPDAFYDPYDEDEAQEYYEPPEIEKEVKPQKDAVDEAVEDWERLMTVSGVINEGRLSGEGTGNEVVATVAAVLDNAQYYGFEIEFYRIGDNVPTPWDKKDG